MPQATLDLRLVLSELRQISDVSEGIRKALAKVLQEIRRDPTCFDDFEVPTSLQPFLKFVAFKKAYITNQKHSYRLLFAHGRSARDDGLLRCIGLVAFKRETGYTDIDWDSLAIVISDTFGDPPANQT